MTRFQLKYSAKAGLLPELSRQTYDSLYKALREVVLNSLDADARTVILDFSKVSTDRELVISDDGVGMTLADLQESFLSLGGSRKYGVEGKFGRIGIGSLALLHYAETAIIETKPAGARQVTEARLSHPWSLDKEQRTVQLADVPAGVAAQRTYEGSQRDHFTRVRLLGVADEVLAECSDVARFYALIDRLRVVLPLPLAESPLVEVLRDVSPELVEVLSAHIGAYSGNVVVRSQWHGDLKLERRLYGEEADEQWHGSPRAILKHLDVTDGCDERTVTVAGYLLSQAHAAPRWSGITTRVQSVAVEERSFFDVEGDPGFRKYITGEIFLLGEIDRSRLINIDRTSFNRESPDYQVVQRYMAAEVLAFKSEQVQQPRRSKVVIKREVDNYCEMLGTVQSACASADAWCAANDVCRVPSSNNGPIRILSEYDLVEHLQSLGAQVVIQGGRDGSARGWDLSLGRDGRQVVASLPPCLVAPEALLAGATYKVRFVQCRETDPPIVIKTRPRELLLNTGHYAIRGSERTSALRVALILELAYVLASSVESNELYDRILELLALASEGRVVGAAPR